MANEGQAVVEPDKKETAAESETEVDFVAHAEQLQKLTLCDDEHVSSLASMLEGAEKAGRLNDKDFIAKIANANKVEPAMLEVAIDLIKDKSKNQSKEKVIVNTDGKLEKQTTKDGSETTQKSLSREEKLAAENAQLQKNLDEANANYKEKSDTLAKYEPNIIRYELTTHPLLLARYMRRRIRARMIRRKSREPYELLYYLAKGQARRFISTKTRMKNVGKIFEEIERRCGEKAQQRATLIADKKDLEKERKLAQAAYAMVKPIKPIKGKDINL